jgi:hypothetical protein
MRRYSSMSSAGCELMNDRRATVDQGRAIALRAKCPGGGNDVAVPYRRVSPTGVLQRGGGDHLRQPVHSIRKASFILHMRPGCREGLISHATENQAVRGLEFLVLEPVAVRSTVKRARPIPKSRILLADGVPNDTIDGHVFGNRRFAWPCLIPALSQFEIR